MGNTYFRFKQFSIEQGSCAMKVTTDACIQGAWTPIRDTVKHVLDIGTGTGLLALMAAQRAQDAAIDAIEYEPQAALQAADNFKASPWAQRLNGVEGDVRVYKALHKYDLIIANPPFFSNSLTNHTPEKTLARHTVGLSAAELIRAIITNLNDDGYASVLLPQAAYEQFKEHAAQNGLYECSKLCVRHTLHAPVKRVVGLFALVKAAEPGVHELIIKAYDNSYTTAFIKLLAPFYLML